MPGKLHLKAANSNVLLGGSEIPYGVLGKISVEELITDEYYNAYALDECGKSPLEYAATSGSEETVSYLIEELDALSHLDINKKVRLLILATANLPNVQFYLANLYHDKKLMTPLQLAAYLGHSEKVLHLLTTQPQSILESGHLNKTVFYWVSLNGNANQLLTRLESHKSFKPLTDEQRDTLWRNAAAAYAIKKNYQTALEILLKINTYTDRDFINLAKYRRFKCKKVIAQASSYVKMESANQFPFRELCAAETEMQFAIDNLSQVQNKNSEHYYQLSLCLNHLSQIKFHLKSWSSSRDSLKKSLTHLSTQVSQLEPNYTYNLGITHKLLADALLEAHEIPDDTSTIEAHYEKAIECLLKVSTEFSAPSSYYKNLMTCYASLGDLYYDKACALDKLKQDKQALEYHNKAAAIGHKNAAITLGKIIIKNPMLPKKISDGFKLLETYSAEAEFTEKRNKILIQYKKTISDPGGEDINYLINTLGYPLDDEFKRNLFEYAIDQRIPVSKKTKILSSLFSSDPKNIPYGIPRFILNYIQHIEADNKQMPDTKQSATDSKQNILENPVRLVKKDVMQEEYEECIKLNAKNFEDGIKIHTNFINLTKEKRELMKEEEYNNLHSQLIEAVALLEKAAENGHRQANEKLGDIYTSKCEDFMVRNNYSKALMHFKLSGSPKYSTCFDHCIATYKAAIDNGDIEKIVQLVDEYSFPIDSKTASLVLPLIMSAQIKTETKHAMLHLFVIRGLEIPIGYPHLAVFNTAVGPDKSEAYVIDSCIRSDVNLIKIMTDYMGIRNSGNHNLFWEKRFNQGKNVSVPTQAITTGLNK